jgi:hypothetical protein
VIVAARIRGSHHQGVNPMFLQEFERRRASRKHKKPSPREAERRQRQRQQSDPVREREIARIGHNAGPPLTPAPLNRVLSFGQWCALNGFSKATGRRIVQRGEGPPVLQLSPRRIGIRESDNAAWQQARAR